MNWINENGGYIIMMVLMFGPLYLMCWTSYRQDFAKPAKKNDVVTTREIGFDDLPESLRKKLGEKK